MHLFKSVSHAILALGHAGIATCAKLLSGGTIIAFDQDAKELNVIRGGSILVEGNRIVSVSDVASPLDTPAGVEVVGCTDKTTTPGFIDTHRHGWQTVFKTMGSNTTLAEYAMRYSALAARPLFTPDDLYISQLAGIYEALAAGVTTIVDHAHHTWTPDHSAAGLRASVDSGARVFWAYAFQNSSAEFRVPQQIAQWKELASKTSNLTELAIAYDYFTTNPDGADTLAVADLIKETKSLLTTHHVEGPLMLGNSPQDLHRAGVLDSSTPVVISHATFLDVRGAALLRRTNQHISITPESEMHYGHLHPTSHLIMDQASLGVDTHMTFSSDVLTQARLWLQSVRYRIYQNTVDRFEVPAQNPFSVNQDFLLATRNGGLAVGRKDLGVISEGAKADLVVWEGRSPAMLGWTDPVAAVILHASVGDIAHVLVDGAFRKRNGRLVDDRYYDSVQDQFLETARRIQAILKKTPLPSLEGNFLTGMPYGKVMQVDAKRGEGTGYGSSFV
ncbi:Metallo-dependent hydrolase [Apiospora arundinis]